MKSLLNLFIGLLAFLFILMSKYNNTNPIETVSKSIIIVTTLVNSELTNDVICNIPTFDGHEVN